MAHAAKDATKWVSAAAAQGDARAQAEWGWLLLHGLPAQSTPMDDEDEIASGAALSRRLEDAGLESPLVKQDIPEGLRILRHAAEQGEVQAMHMLAEWLVVAEEFALCVPVPYEGDSTKKACGDHCQEQQPVQKEGVQAEPEWMNWYRRAATKGHLNSCFMVRCRTLRSRSAVVPTCFTRIPRQLSLICRICCILGISPLVLTASC